MQGDLTPKLESRGTDPCKLNTHVSSILPHQTSTRRANRAHSHALKYADARARNMHAHTHTRVRQMSGNTASVAGDTTISPETPGSAGTLLRDFSEESFHFPEDTHKKRASLPGIVAPQRGVLRELSAESIHLPDDRDKKRAALQSLAAAHRATTAHHLTSENPRVSAPEPVSMRMDGHDKPVSRGAVGRSVTPNTRVRLSAHEDRDRLRSDMCALERDIKAVERRVVLLERDGEKRPGRDASDELPGDDW
jgi:hypothetical protein